jgi:lipopolysaccharide cholinephosphotransferase
MKKISSNQIKHIELEILIQFDRFCEENNLKYYLSGGTLLGAIRHKGFIPWDDDIDVCMPRSDYEIFVKSFRIKNKNLEIRSNILNNFSAPFSKIVNLKTNIITKYSGSDVDTCLWIDIFPVDGLPADLEKVKDIYNICNFYRTILGLTSSRLGEGTTIFRKYSKFLLKPIAKLYGKKRCIDKIERIAKQYNYNESKYVGAITWGLYGVGERMLKVDFEKSIEVEFEGYKFPTFSCWDSYLKGLYGDYMQLPPLEKRKTHNMEVYMEE